MEFLNYCDASEERLEAWDEVFCTPTKCQFAHLKAYDGCDEVGCFLWHQEHRQDDWDLAVERFEEILDGLK